MYFCKAKRTFDFALHFPLENVTNAFGVFSAKMHFCKKVKKQSKVKCSAQHFGVHFPLENVQQRNHSFFYFLKRKRNFFSKLIQNSFYKNIIFFVIIIIKYKSWGCSSTVRAPPCHGGSCGFESRQSRFIFYLV